VQSKPQLPTNVRDSIPTRINRGFHVANQILCWILALLSSVNPVPDLELDLHPQPPIVLMQRQKQKLATIAVEPREARPPIGHAILAGRLALAVSPPQCLSASQPGTARKLHILAATELLRNPLGQAGFPAFLREIVLPIMQELARNEEARLTANTHQYFPALCSQKSRTSSIFSHSSPTPL